MTLCAGFIFYFLVGLISWCFFHFCTVTPGVHCTLSDLTFLCCVWDSGHTTQNRFWEWVCGGHYCCGTPSRHFCLDLDHPPPFFLFFWARLHFSLFFTFHLGNKFVWSLFAVRFLFSAQNFYWGGTNHLSSSVIMCVNVNIRVIVNTLYVPTEHS